MKENGSVMEEIGMMLGTNPNSIYEDLYKEDIEIIRLHYDRASKFATIGNASFGPLLAVTIALREQLRFRFRFFLLGTIYCLWRLCVWNVKMNKCFNMLNKKIKEQTKGF